MKLGFLISLASVVANAATVQGDGIMMVAEVDDGDGAHARESRSPEGLGIPWYLDRINQQEPVLDGEYDTFASGKISHNLTHECSCTFTYIHTMHVYLYSYIHMHTTCM